MIMTAAAPAFCALPAAFGGESRGEMRRRDDDRDPPGGFLHRGVGHGQTLVVAQRELLRPVREDADRVGAGLDQELGQAALAREVEVALVGERGRRDGDDAAEHAPLGDHAGRSRPRQASASRSMIASIAASGIGSSPPARGMSLSARMPAIVSAVVAIG